METPFGNLKNNFEPKKPLLGVIEEESHLDMETIKVLKSIDNSLKEIKGLLEINEKKCSKMADHIDFVEDVYGTLRSPLEFIRSKLSFSNSDRLPTIKN